MYIEFLGIFKRGIRRRAVPGEIPVRSGDCRAFPRVANGRSRPKHTGGQLHAVIAGSCGSRLQKNDIPVRGNILKIMKKGCPKSSPHSPTATPPPKISGAGAGGAYFEKQAGPEHIWPGLKCVISVSRALPLYDKKQERRYNPFQSASRAFSGKLPLRPCRPGTRTEA